LHGSLLHSVPEHDDISNKDISQGSAATRLKYGMIFNRYFTTFNMESEDEMLSKIGQQLVK